MCNFGVILQKQSSEIRQKYDMTDHAPELMNIRTAVLEDLPILYEFEQGIIATERPFDPTLRKGHITYYDLKEKILSDNSEIIVVEIDDEIIGSAFIEVRLAHSFQQFTNYAYIGFMYVKPEYRGKGISHQIIMALNAWADSRNLKEIRLEVYSANTAAQRAYEKSGFDKHIIEMRMALETNK